MVTLKEVSAAVRARLGLKRRLANDDVAYVAELLCRVHLNRKLDEATRGALADQIVRGVPIRAIGRDLDAGDEGRRLAEAGLAVDDTIRLRRADIAYLIDLLYLRHLDRAPDPAAQTELPGHFEGGLSFRTFGESLDASEEGRSLAESGRSIDKTLRLRRDDLNDVIDLMYRACLDREPDSWARSELPAHIERGLSLRELRKSLVSSEEGQLLAKLGQNESVPATDRIGIMGTDRTFSMRDWTERLAELDIGALPAHPRAEQSFAHSGTYEVSILTSLYRGRDFIERFLENLTSQTIFDRCELIIVDANSPDGEREHIAAYQKRFPNIVYHHVNHRIGIYDAWNVAIEMARGAYLTNANLDDLRRRDSLEVQRSALNANPDAGIVYQNFFYTLDPSLPFEVVAAAGFVSDLPQVSGETLLRMNSPHNAPMWRRSLHDELGLFDTAFRSAGDWEFWLRCLRSGARFHRTDDAHVAYYVNPAGLSTSGSVRVFEEQRWVRARYERYFRSEREDASR